MKSKKVWMYLLVALLFSACAGKHYSKQESAYIVFKTPTVKHADMGFIYASKEDIKIELYSAGQPVMALEVSPSSVCMSLFECMDKSAFNTAVLSHNYPADILDRIFRAEAIMGGKNKQMVRNGFTQKISQTNKYEIIYTVLNNQTIFRDTINNIVIKIKRLK